MRKMTLMRQHAATLFVAVIVSAALATQVRADLSSQPKTDEAQLKLDREHYDVSPLKRGLFVRHHWAVVNANGKPARGRNVIRAKKLGTGIYEVSFTRDVRNGVYVATVGTGEISVARPGQISVSPRWKDAHGVFIRTTNSSGVRADMAFHIIVLTD